MVANQYISICLILKYIEYSQEIVIENEDIYL